MKKFLKSAYILLLGLVNSFLLLTVFFNLSRAGKPHDSGDLALYVMSVYIVPILWLPVSLVLYLIAGSENENSNKRFYVKTIVVTITLLLLAFLTDQLLRG